MQLSHKTLSIGRLSIPCLIIPWSEYILYTIRALPGCPLRGHGICSSHCQTSWWDGILWTNVLWNDLLEEDLL